MKKFLGKRYHLIERKRASLLQKNGVQTLSDLAGLLTSNNIHYWVDAGTLLGIVRDGNFIDDDTDIDIGVVITNPDDLFNLLKVNGYNIWYYFDTPYGRKRLIRAEKYQVGIDFEVFERDGDKYYYDSPSKPARTSKQWKKKRYSVIRFYFDAEIVASQKRHNFMGIELNIPENYDEYFRVYYKDWRVRQDKENYLDSHFRILPEDYKHHNDSACYKEGVYLYKRAVSPTTVKVGFLERWRMSTC